MEENKAIVLLQICAWLIVIAGCIAALFIGLPAFSAHSTDWSQVWFSVGIVVGSFVAFVFLLVICSIGENLIAMNESLRAIRKSTQAKSD